MWFICLAVRVDGSSRLLPRGNLVARITVVVDYYREEFLFAVVDGGSSSTTTICGFCVSLTVVVDYYREAR